MRFLSTVRFAVVTVEDRQQASFVVPVEVGMIVFWFLATRSAWIAALIGWWLLRDVIHLYRRLCNYLIGWWVDLQIIFEAIRLMPDYLQGEVRYAFRT